MLIHQELLVFSLKGIRMTLVKLLRNAVGLNPDKPAVIQDKRILRYCDLYQQACALSVCLLDGGLEKGGRVGLLLEKSPDVIICFLGVAMAGGVVFPIDSNQQESTIGYVLDLTGPSALIVDQKFLPLVPEKILCGRKTKIIVTGSTPSGSGQYSLSDVFARRESTEPALEIKDDDLVYLNFTSGTTGVPKGAVTTHANIYWNTKSAVESLGLLPDDSHICMFPVSLHPHELFARSLYLGGTAVLTEGISPKAVAKAISDHSVTCMMAVATIYAELVRLRSAGAYDIGSMRVAESGGMHITPPLAEALRKAFPVPVVPVWGSTETTGIAIANYAGEEMKPGSVGRVMPYYQARLLNEDGEEADDGEIGQLTLAGPGVCGGYFRNDEETAKHMKDGWVHTGDLMKRDTDGHHFFINRESRMIKVAGTRVYPSQVERVIELHKDVLEVAVVRARDKSRGEVPRAVIVLKDGIDGDKASIRRHCEKMLSRQKVPRIIDFVEELPKSPSGKILYKEMEAPQNIG